MNTDVLQCFIKVYEKKSITLAAKDLFITPQGLSKAIKQLELDLQVELFYRTARGMEATEYGELLYARAKHICYLIEDIKKEISITSESESILNVVVTYATTSALPPDFLFGFSDVHPNLQIKLKEFPDEYPIRNLFQEEAEVGLVMGHEDIDNCDYELMIPGETVILVSKNHPLAIKNQISVMELENEPLILKSVEPGTEHGFVDKCLEYAFTPLVKHETGNIANAHILCESKGLVAVSIDFVEEALKNEKLKVIKLKEKIPQNIYLVIRKKEIQSRAVNLFKKYIKEYCRDSN